jgi:NAD(P)-dependent dehydrogenase (short-subunit alcohol dehydrogenase family)
MSSPFRNGDPGVSTVNDGRSFIVRFSLDDLMLFSAASHDRNPCHISPEYARKTPYGQLLVYGILGALAGLARVEPPPHCTLSKVSLDFRHPMFLDIDYSAILVKQSPQSFSMKVCDGSKILMKAEFAFGESGPVEMAWGKPPRSILQVPSDRDEKEFKEGAITKGEYLPDQTALAALLDRFAIDEPAFGRLQISALLWSSYLVGMVQPGLHALFHKLTLAFENLDRGLSRSLSFEAKVISLNSLGSLRSELRLFAGDQLVARGESRAFFMPKNRVGLRSAVEALLPQSNQLGGKVALVIGASRGLGAMLTTALALQGCTVLANFDRSEPEAQQLQESLADASGGVVLAKGDAGDVAWCEQLAVRVSREFGRLDFLICNACPSLLPLRLEPRMVGRINSYVGNALALVSVPMSVFCGLLAEGSGSCVVISSVAVETTPKEWPHYVAVKCAAEGLVRVAALQYPNLNFLLVRPPKLRTDLTNGPSSALFGQGEGMHSEVAAAKIVQRLQGVAREQVVEVFIP